MCSMASWASHSIVNCKGSGVHSLYHNVAVQGYIRKWNPFFLPFLSYIRFMLTFFFFLNSFDKEPFGDLLFTLLVPSPCIIMKIAPSYLALGECWWGWASLNTRMLSCKQAKSREPRLHLTRYSPKPVLSLGETVKTLCLLNSSVRLTVSLRGQFLQGN